MKADPWPVRQPGGWEKIVQAAMPVEELERVRTSLRRGRPFGSEQWMLKTARQLGLGFTLQDRGRPKKDRERPPARPSISLT